MTANATTLLSIYNAALDNQSWQPALQSLAGDIGSIGAVLIATDRVQLPFSIEQSSFPLQNVRCYFDHYGHHDREVMQGRLQSHEPLTILRDVDVWTDEKLTERPDYKWLAEKAGAKQRALVRLSNTAGWCDLLAILFDKHWDAIPNVSSRLSPYLPHLAKVVEVNRQFSLLRQMYGAALAALDKLRIGTCIVDRNGQIILENTEAGRILSLRDGLSRTRTGRISIEQLSERTKFECFVSWISDTAAGDGGTAEYSCLASRSSGLPSFILELCPLRDSLGEVERNLSGCLVFIVDPMNLGRISTERMAKLFTLTEAESVICKFLVGGKNLPEIAEMRGVAEGTIKAQTRSIYAKCSVKSRVDLIRLALSIEPPLISSER